MLKKRTNTKHFLQIVVFKYVFLKWLNKICHLWVCSKYIPEIHIFFVLIKCREEFFLIYQWYNRICKRNRNDTFIFKYFCYIIVRFDVIISQQVCGYTRTAGSTIYNKKTPNESESIPAT